MLKFLGDVFKPLLTLIVTVVGVAFLVSVFSPRADAVIEQWIPLWSALDPAVATVQAWLGVHQEEIPAWQFWRN